MFMSTEINLEDLSFLQLADSLFPTGLYATSSGLEALSYTKKLKPNDIRGLIDVYLRQQVGPSDCTALGNTYESIKKSDLHGLINVDQTLSSMRIIEAFLTASMILMVERVCSTLIRPCRYDFVMVSVVFPSGGQSEGPTCCRR